MCSISRTGISVRPCGVRHHIALRIVGYEVAMRRLLDAKPIVEVDPEPRTAPGSAPVNANSGRASSRLIASTKGGNPGSPCPVCIASKCAIRCFCWRLDGTCRVPCGTWSRCVWRRGSRGWPSIRRSPRRKGDPPVLLGDDLQQLLLDRLPGHFLTTPAPRGAAAEETLQGEDPARASAPTYHRRHG